jgi:YedE family putative selenium metabolism protein
MSNKFKPAWLIIITGAVFGCLIALLMKWGNPPNMGVCALCFIRDVAGALRLHTVNKASYLRPEIAGFILGATIVALITREFKTTGGSSPILRFIVGALVSAGGLVFMGCPIRMFGRIAGGDWTALEGLLGITIGIFIGVQFLKAGFAFGPSKSISGSGRWVAWILPVIALTLLALRIFKPPFLVFGKTPYAPLLLSFTAGLVLSGLAQRSRFCSIGGIRDVFLFGNTQLLQGTIVLLVAAFGMNLILGQFHPGKYPLAHPYFIWNVGSMFLVGLGLVMLGACPFRQMVVSGTGDADAGITVLGMLAGGALAHNCLMAATPAGVPLKGKLIVIVGIVVLLAIGFLSRVRTKKEG